MRSTPLLIALMAATYTSGAASQTPEQVPGPDPEDILVTAVQLSEDASDLPMSWASVDADAVAFTGAIHINELMQQVPGAWVNRGNGQESLISLRSPVFTGAGSCGAFFVAADNISLRAPGFCNINQLFDTNSEQAGRIEVIKGPATSLYGSNAMHGVINVLSAAPTQSLDSNLSLEAGPYDYYRSKFHYRNTQGAHGLSLNLNGTTDGGYKDDSGYDQQKMTLRYDYTGERWDISNVLDMANLNQETAGYIQGYKAYEDEDLKRTNPNPEAYRDAYSVRFYSKLSTQLDQFNTLTITPYLRDNEMEFLQHYLPWQPVEENGHSSLGLRTTVHTNTDDFLWVNGVDLEYTDGWLKEVQEQPFSPNQPAGVHYDYQVDATVAAAYTQLTTSPNNQWEFTGGLRLEYTHYDYNNLTDDGPACGPEATACRFYRPADSTDDFFDWSLNFGASYQINPQHLAYLRMARGFRPPQATELYRLQGGQEQADLDSEELSNMELGWRADWNGNLQSKLSGYYMRKKNVIFQDANRFNVSDAETLHYGLEFSVDYQFAEDWNLGVVGTLARHEYDNDIQLLGTDSSIKGNIIDSAPESLGSARLGWDFSDLTGQNSFAQLEWIYLSSYYLEPENEHKYAGHSLLNLRLSSDFGSSWQGTLRLTNLLDADYAERADYGFGQYRYFVGQPLGAYLELSYQFGAR